ncbi:MAG TPA: hypothetical protein VEK08_04275 [Planctomycetota bacterium]|nr:hypothetical protein [Planctomycetota bacterium]
MPYFTCIGPHGANREPLHLEGQALYPKLTVAQDYQFERLRHALKEDALTTSKPTYTTTPE